MLTRHIDPSAVRQRHSFNPIRLGLVVHREVLLENHIPEILGKILEIHDGAFARDGSWEEEKVGFHAERRRVFKTVGNRRVAVPQTLIAYSEGIDVILAVTCVCMRMCVGGR